MARAEFPRASLVFPVRGCNLSGAARVCHYEKSTLMSSVIPDMETMPEGKTAAKNERLSAWVEEVAQLCKPDRVQWCDGSHEEYQAMLRLMVLTGTAIWLDESKRPNSILCRSSPGDVARVEERTLICA